MERSLACSSWQNCCNKERRKGLCGYEPIGKGGPVLCWSKEYKPTYGLKENFFVSKSNTNEQLFEEAKAVMKRIGLPINQEGISKDSWSFSTGVIHFQFADSVIGMNKKKKKCEESSHNKEG
jgi:hypothetical protein